MTWLVQLTQVLSTSAWSSHRQKRRRIRMPTAIRLQLATDLSTIFKRYLLSTICTRYLLIRNNRSACNYNFQFSRAPSLSSIYQFGIIVPLAITIFNFRNRIYQFVSRVFSQIVLKFRLHFKMQNMNSSYHSLFSFYLDDRHMIGHPCVHWL